MLFVPLLHYFKCKNTYSGNEYGLRYRLTPGKRSVPDPDGGEGATKEESILTVDYWPDPWTLEMTDPALRRQEIFPLTDEGRAAAAQSLQEDFNAEPDSPVIAHVGEDGFLRDARLTAAARSGPAWSFSDFGRIPEAERPLLDYIFIGGGIRAVRCEVLPDTLGGGYLSDPAPVAATLEFNR